MKSFCVIGLGNFGRNLALTLAKGRNQVLVIDDVQDAVDNISDFVTDARWCEDPTNESKLRSAGVTNYDCCIVCMDNTIHDNTLITLILKEMGIKKIVTRATSDLHKKVLLKVGADMVVFPEQDMGKKLALTLSKTDMFEYINLSNDYSIIEIKAPRRWVGHSIKDLSIRQKYGVNLIAMQTEDSPGDYTLFNDPNKIIHANEMLVIIGSNHDIDKITKG